MRPEPAPRPDHSSRKRVCLLAVTALMLAACSSSDPSDSSDSSEASIAPTSVVVAPTTESPAPTTIEPTPTSGAPTTAAAPSTAPPTTVAAEPVQILVTNDDGIGAPGIDAVVEALRTLDGVEVTVVAPATQQSGTGGNTSPGPLVGTDTTTASGYPAVAVEGFPADSVIWAIDDGGIEFVPDLVVSGINEGQNLGPFVDLSGTVGAARAAVQRGIPAIAISQGLTFTDGAEPDFETGAEALLDYLADNLDNLDDLVGSAPVSVVNINVPSCEEGATVAGVAEVPTQPTIDDMALALAAQVCASAGAAPTTEVAAFTAGFVTINEVPSVPAPAG